MPKWGAEAETTTLGKLDTFPIFDVVPHIVNKSCKKGVKTHAHNGGPYYLKTTTADSSPRIAGSMNSNSCSSCHDHEANVPTPDKEIIYESSITPEYDKSDSISPIKEEHKKCLGRKCPAGRPVNSPILPSQILVILLNKGP